MDSRWRSWTAILVRIVIAVSLMTAAGCKTSGGSKSTGAPTHMAQGGWPETLDVRVAPEVRAGVFVGETPFVVKYRPGKWSELRTFAERLFESVKIPENVRDQVRGSVEPYLEEGLLAGYAQAVDNDGLPDDLDRTRAIWATAFPVGDDGFLRGYRLGLAALVPEEIPEAIATRVLLPSERPDALAEQLEDWVDRYDDGRRIEVVPGDAYVRVTAVPVREDWSGEKRDSVASRAFDRIGPNDSELDDPTPALARFVASDGYASGYVDLRDARDFAALRAAMETVRNYTGADRRGRRRLLVGSTHELLAARRSLSTETLEYTDHAFVLRGDEEGGATANGYATRTKLGREVADTVDDETSLPAFADDAWSDDDMLAAGDWTYDIASVRENLHVDSFSDRDARGRDRLQQILRNLVPSDSTSAMLLGLGAPNVLARVAPEQMARLAPVAGRIRLDRADESERVQGPPLPRVVALMSRVILRSGPHTRFDRSTGFKPAVRGAAVLVWPEGSRGIRERLGRVFDRWSRASSFQYDMSRRDSGRLEVRVAQNISLDRAFADGRETLSGVSVEIEPARLTPIWFRGLPNVPSPFESAKLSKLGPLELETGSTPAVGHLRLRWSDAPPETVEPPSYDYSPAPRYPCRERLRRAGFALFEKLRGSPYRDVFLEQYGSGLFADYDRALAACGSKLSGGSEAVEFAKGRARLWALAFTGRMIPDRSTIVDGCDEGSKRACEYLEQHPKEQYERLVSAMTEMAAEACEYGDSAGCRFETVLEKDGTVPDLKSK